MNHRVTKEPLDVIWSNSPAQAGPPRPSCPGWQKSRQLLNISEDEDSTNFLGTLCQCSITFTVKICSELPVLLLVPIAPQSGIWHHQKEPGASLFAPSLQVFTYSSKKPFLLQVTAVSVSPFSFLFSLFFGSKYQRT